MGFGNTRKEKKSKEKQRSEQKITAPGSKEQEILGFSTLISQW
jgi:hypothetical protein